ncbi:hypothetical protein [Hymenobacter crusticola]|uniref:hypothetical protein n=1 Tax=Hymenobacter crusticola TaxID=1770526 RepID=UPI001FEA1EAE|nr:hypothetical protein [Hymenobacter crusticola]
MPAEVGSKPAGAPGLVKAAQAMAAVGDEVLGVPGFLMGVAKWWGNLTAKAA